MVPYANNKVVYHFEADVYKRQALDGVKISLGERFKPYLMDALDWMIEKMPDIEDTLLLTMDRIDEFVDHTKAVSYTHLLPGS